MRVTEDRESETSLIELVDGFNKLKGWALFRELFKWVFTGVFMGSSDAIPGYSGGTTLALLGFFKRLIFIAKSVFVPEPGLTRTKAFTFLLPFGIGWFAGVFGAAKVIELMITSGLGLELAFFFSAFISFAIPIFIRSERPHVAKKYDGYKKRIGFMFIGMTFVLGLALLLRFLPGIGYGGEWTPDQINTKVEDWNNYEYDFKNSWLLIIVAYLAGCMTLIPGGSGAIIQLLGGQYTTIHAGILANPFGNDGANFGAVCIYAVSTFAGLTTMVFIMSWFLKKHERALAAASLGMLIASIFAVLIAPDFADYSLFNEWQHIVGVVGAWLLGMTCALTIQLVIHIRSKDPHKKKKKKVAS